MVSISCPMVRRFSIFRILHWACGHTGRDLNIEEHQTPKGALRGGFLFLEGFKKHIIIII
jgi:hypothetical protein